MGEEIWYGTVGCSTAGTSVLVATAGAALRMSVTIRGIQRRVSGQPSGPGGGCQRQRCQRCRLDLRHDAHDNCGARALGRRRQYEGLRLRLDFDLDLHRRRRRSDADHSDRWVCPVGVCQYAIYGWHFPPLTVAAAIE